MSLVAEREYNNHTNNFSFRRERERELVLGTCYAGNPRMTGRFDRQEALGWVVGRMRLLTGCWSVDRLVEAFLLPKELDIIQPKDAGKVVR